MKDDTDAGYKYAALVFSSPAYPARQHVTCDGKEILVGSLPSFIPQNEHARWEKWLGSYAWGKIERANCVVILRAASPTPGVLDDEDKRLRREMNRLWEAFLLCGATVSLDPAWIVSGQATGDPFGASLRTVRGFQEMDRIVWPFYRDRLRFIEIMSTADMKQGGRLDYSWFSRWLEIDKLLSQSPWPQLLGYARLAYSSARTRNYLEFSIPEFVRAAEGVIALERRTGNKTFRERALRLVPWLAQDEYVGSDIESLLLDLYQLRSDCVHGKLPFIDLQSSGDAGEERAAQFAYLAETLAREAVLIALRHPDRSIFDTRERLEQAWSSGSFPPVA